MANIISKIEYGKKNNARVNIYIDGKYSFSILDELVYKKGLKIGMELDNEFLKEVLDEDEINKAKSTAVRILSRSNPSEKVLKAKLSEKYSTWAVDRTMETLKEYKIIEDQKLAHMMIRDGINLKRFGKIRIKSDMLKKGIPASICDQALQNYDFSEDLENALYHARKKVKNPTNMDKNKLRHTLTGYLQYRGFDYEIIRDVINKLTQED